MTERSGGGAGAQRPWEFAAEVVATTALLVSGAGLAIALVALLYTGPLIGGRPTATASLLVAAGIGAVWLAVRSRIVPLAAVPQDAPTVVLVAVLASVMADNPDLGAAGGSTDWVMVLLAGATLLSGALMWTLGRFRLGEAVRYLPTVVVNAFVAGTGWLLAKGGFDVMTGANLELVDVGELFGGDLAGRWLPGLVLALLVFGFGVSKRIPEAATSAVIVLAVIGFYTVVSLTSSVSAVEDDGWLIGPFDSATRPAVVTPDMLGEFPTSEILGSRGDVLSLLIITVVALLLNLSALETTRRQRVDTSHELKEAGLANVVISPTGAVPVFHALGDTLLAEQMGVRRRWIPAAGGVGLAVLGIVGAGVVGYVPVFVAGGLLVAVGLNLLAGWAGFMSGAIGWTERLVGATVLGLIIVVGILEGVVIGLILACALFVFRYSRVDPVRRQSNLSVTRSRIERTGEQTQILRRLAHQAQVFELQGFLFFGSTTRLADAVRSVALAEESDVHTVVFDLRFLTGLEPGTSTVMSTLFEDLADAEVDVVISAATPSQLVAFAGSGDRPTVATLEEAMEMVENEVLNRSATAAAHAEGAGTADGIEPRPWLDTFERTEVEPGTVLMAEGDAADTLLFLLSGTCSVYSSSASGDRHRIRQFVGPSWIGEIGFLRAAPRSADVVAETAVTYAVIDRDGFDELREQEPVLTADLLYDIATTAADRAATVTDALTHALD
ncbi:MAG: SulP family inorganic anion transporter [Actinomycetota bacterium]